MKNKNNHLPLATLRAKRDAALGRVNQAARSLKRHSRKVEELRACNSPFLAVAEAQAAASEDHCCQVLEEWDALCDQLRDAEMYRDRDRQGQLDPSGMYAGILA